MGMYLSNTVRYGFPISDDSEEDLPWAKFGKEDDPDEGILNWWMDKHNYVMRAINPFTPEGEYAEGFDRDSNTSAWFNERKAFEVAYPIPFEIEYTGVMDYPSKFIRVSGMNGSTVYSHGALINPQHLLDCIEEHKDEIAALKAIVFDETNPIPVDDEELSWYALSSYG